MYAGKTYAAGGFVYKDAGSGPYTHYVDNTNSASTDTNNPYGTKEKPRKTIPNNLPKGSVVEVHGGHMIPIPEIWRAVGTSDNRCL
jgi:hypothetical protein